MRSTSEVRDSVNVIYSSPGEIREYDATWFPEEHPKFINLTGVHIQGSENFFSGSEVEFIMDLFNQSTLRFEYFESDAYKDSHNRTFTNGSAFQFLFRSFAVFEYIERNNQTGFQNDTEDLITGVYDLSSPYLPCKDLVWESQNFTVNGTEVSVWYVTAETQDSVFTMRFIVAGTNVEVEGVTLTSSTSKIDVDIKWFTDDHVKANWTDGPSHFPEAHVGLLSVFAAAVAEAQFDSDATSPLNNSNPTVSFADAGYVGFFSYETQADTVVNGVQGAGFVHAEINEASEGSIISESFSEEFIIRILWFSFDGVRPSEVSWDPEFGAVIPGSSNNNPTLTSTSTSTTGNISNGFQLVPSIVFVVSSFFLCFF